MKLKGKVAVITGAGRGIGEAIALAFAEQGAHLALGARTAAELEVVAEKCQARGGSAMWRITDVTVRESIGNLVHAARTSLGPVDILVNCAGVYGPIGRLAEFDEHALADWLRSAEVNLNGTLYACHAVLLEMMTRRRGKIVTLSGGGATTPLPRLSAYAATKAAVVRLMETLAEEMREFNVQINSIAPGLVDTRLQNDVLKAGEKAGELYDRIRNLRETGAGGTTPELVSELAVFLASDASNGLTGKLISAPHDPWKAWGGREEELNRTAMYTVRRMDPHTIRPLLDKIK